MAALFATLVEAFSFGEFKHARAIYSMALIRSGFVLILLAFISLSSCSKQATRQIANGPDGLNNNVVPVTSAHAMGGMFRYSTPYGVSLHEGIPSLREYDFLNIRSERRDAFDGTFIFSPTMSIGTNDDILDRKVSLTANTFPFGAYPSPAIYDSIIAYSIANVISARKWSGYQSYRSRPYYYFQRSQEFIVAYFTCSDLPLGLQYSDTEYDISALNDFNIFPRTGVTSYYTEQSYGRFVPSFNIIHFRYYIDPDIWQRGRDFDDPMDQAPLFREVIEDDSNYMLGKIMKPVIIFGGYEGEIWGANIRYTTDVFWNEEDKGKESYYALIRAGYAHINIGKFNEEKARYGYDFYGTIIHEMGHVMNWFDTYSKSEVEGFSTVDDLDLMGAGTSYAPLGIHKVIAGWTCFVNIKHNAKHLSIKPQDIYNNPREIYFLKMSSAEPAEFFYMENQWGRRLYQYQQNNFFPQKTGEGTGLAIIRCYFEKPESSGAGYPAFSVQSRRIVKRDRVLADGTILRIIDNPFTFPYVQGDYGPGAFVEPVKHNGMIENIAVRNIKYLSNTVYLPYLGLRPIQKTCLGYGDIICDVDVGSPLLGDVNGDGIVNEGDAAMLRLNMGRRVGIDALAVPVDVNGDGFLKLVYDRDEDGFIATSERIYDTQWNLVHTSGDWLDINGDGKNDLDAAGTGQFDAIERWYEEFRRLNREHPPMGGISTRNPPVPWHEMSPGLFEVSARSTGQGLPLASKPIAVWLIDQNEDGIIDFFDAEGDGKATLVPARLDADGDGVITEADAAYMGYYWGETTFEELWIPLPAPSWANY